MNAKHIRPGTTLRLKSARAAVYDRAPYVQVVELVYRNGYKTPFVRSDRDEYFRPSDFDHAVAWTPTSSEVLGVYGLGGV